MIVKRLETSDIRMFRERIYSFIQIDFVTTYGREAEIDYVYSKIDGLEQYMNEGKAYPYGAFWNDELIGFLWGYIIDGPHEKVFHIAYIATDPDYRNIGVGSALLKKVEMEALTLEGVFAIELIVGFKNENAIHFYENHLFDLDRYIYRRRVNKDIKDKE